MWFNLAHVCRKWRAVMFGSSTRLDLGITVGPENSDDIKSILSSPLPSLADYTTHGDIARKALSRLCTTLEHHHYRAREIFRGTSAGFDKFFGVTNHPFPMLESRSLFHKFACEVKFQTPFLGDLSDLHHLRRLRLEPFFPHSYPDLFHPQRLSLTSSFENRYIHWPMARNVPRLFAGHDLPAPSRSSHKSPALFSPSLPEHIVHSSLSATLVQSEFLNAPAAGFSAPSLRDVGILFFGHTFVSHRCTPRGLPRVINVRGNTIMPLEFAWSTKVGIYTSYF